MKKYELKTANGLREFIADGRSKVQRTVANNTVVRVVNEGKDIAVRLHDTDVVCHNGNGTITLSSGGWKTKTTKDRLNTFTEAGISQKAGVWYMKDGSLFYDGIVIKADGTPIKPKQPKAHEKKLKAIKKQAKEYAHGYVEALKKGLIDYPNGGDCWYCLMFKDVSKSNEHLKSHIKEKYYVPSLLVNAGREAGYRDEQIGLMGIGGRRVFIDPERNIYKYLVKHLERDI